MIERVEVQGLVVLLDVKLHQGPRVFHEIQGPGYGYVRRFVQSRPEGRGPKLD